ncbi:MAG: hypothetical protein DI554_09095 [Sphingobium sp.]|nr:MAG: hypothetical protein DI554_09095 [Sphingobium sp.]
MSGRDNGDGRYIADAIAQCGSLQNATGLFDHGIVGCLHRLELRIKERRNAACCYWRTIGHGNSFPYATGDGRGR